MELTKYLTNKDIKIKLKMKYSASMIATQGFAIEVIVE